MCPILIFIKLNYYYYYHQILERALWSFRCPGLYTILILSWTGVHHFDVTIMMRVWDPGCSINTSAVATYSARSTLNGEPRMKALRIYWPWKLSTQPICNNTHTVHLTLLDFVRHPHHVPIIWRCADPITANFKFFFNRYTADNQIYL